MADEEQASQAFQAGPQVLGAIPTIDDGSMDDIIDKLKLLNYETDFCPTGKPAFKPLTKTFFVNAGENANAQFFYFTSLVSWIMRKAGHNGFPPPDQFDDPNATSTNILQELKAMKIQTSNLPPNRIRQGYGETVLTVLMLVVDKALMSGGFAFRPVIYPVSNVGPDDELGVGPDAAGGAGGRDGGDSDIDDRVDVDSEEGDEIYRPVGIKSSGQDTEGGMIVPQVSAETWLLEVERVGPQLQLRGDEAKDWRARIENASTLLGAVEKMYPEVRVMLEALGDDLSKGMERIQKREQSLAGQFSEHVEEYRVKLRELNSAQDQFNTASQSVGQLSAELNSISEALEAAKTELQDRESKLSDPAPLIKIKESVSRIRAEIKEMSLRIGVLQHTVLHYSMRQNAEKRKRQASGHKEDPDETSFAADGPDTSGL